MRNRRFWLGVAISFLLLALLLYRVDSGEIARILSQANYLLLLPAIGLYFAALVFRTLRWHVVLAPVRPIPVLRLWPVMVVGYMANNLLPIRLGEVARSYYLRQREGVSLAAILATIVVERVLDGLTLLFFLAVAALFLPLAGLVQDLAADTGVPRLVLVLGTTLPFTTALGVLLAIAYRPGWVLGLVALAARPLPDRMSNALADLAVLFVSGLGSLRDSRRLVTLFLLSIPVWLLEAAMYFVIAFSFQDVSGQLQPPGLMAAVMMAVTAASNLVTALPSSPGGIGLFEGATIGTLVVMNVGREAATAYAAVLHTALLVPVTLLGLFYLWTSDLSLGQLLRLRRQEAGPDTASEPTGQPTTERRAE